MGNRRRIRDIFRTKIKTLSNIHFKNIEKYSDDPGHWKGYQIKGFYFKEYQFYKCNFNGC